MSKWRHHKGLKRSLWSSAAILWMVLIYALSSVPGRMLGMSSFWTVLWQKSGHVLIFGVLAALYLNVIRAFSGENRSKGGRPIVASLLATVAYALSDELHQMMVPGRFASFRDVLLDTFGAVLVLSVLFAKKKRITQNGVLFNGKTTDRR